MVERHGELGTIRCDATKLRQAIFNLLSNAAKFTHNGSITLSILRRPEAGQEWIEIAVADTGIGISAQQQKALFNNFAQANPKIAAVYGGTGLGLSLSQNLCRLMGGQIDVESELGKGSTFTIRLPAQSRRRRTIRWPMYAAPSCRCMASKCRISTTVFRARGATSGSVC
ncbi:ATP-binding protein [Devosia sp. A8/3-2]|nr:ATP-binding protein [Devosia sp. A8/3-2]